MIYFLLFAVSVAFGFLVGAFMASAKHQQERIINAKPIYEQMKEKYGEGFLDD